MSVLYHGSEVADKYFWTITAPDAKTDVATWWDGALASWRRRAGCAPALALARADVAERIEPGAPDGVAIKERFQCGGLVWLGPLPDQTGGDGWVQGQLATG